MKNKSVYSCRFVHHAKFHCIMTTLNKLFKIGTGKEPDSIISYEYCFSQKSIDFSKATCLFSVSVSTEVFGNHSSCFDIFLC